MPDYRACSFELPLLCLLQFQKLKFLNKLTDENLIILTKHIRQNSQSLAELQTKHNSVINNVPTCLVIRDR